MFPRFKIYSLNFQLLALTILPLTALLILIAFGSQTLHHQAMRSLVGSRDLRAATAAASALSEQIYHRGALLKVLGSSAIDDQNAPLLLENQAYLQDYFDGGLAVFAPDGKLAASSRAELWSAPELREIISQMRSSPEGEVTYSNMIGGTLDPDPFVLAAYRNSNGYVVAAAFSTAHISLPLVTGSFSETGTSILLIDQQHNILFQSGSLPTDESMTNHPGIAEALAGQSGITYSHSGQEEHVIAYSSIQPLGWALLVEEPWQVIASPWLRTTQTAPLVLVPVLLLAILALLFGARQIVQPLQALGAQAIQLSRGNYQAVENPVGGISEIRRLQGEMISMARKLHAAQESLKRYIGVITNSQEEERRRLARELHDDTLQALIALNQRLQLARMSLGTHPAAASFEEIQALTGQTIQNLRRLTRALRPIYLEDLGLVASLEVLCQETSRSLDIPVEFACTGDERRLPPETELTLYRMAQEALSNVARHSQAGEASLTLNFTHDGFILKVKDNGKGFLVPENPSDFAQQNHFGLLGLFERAELVGASLEIKSQPGKGTQVSICLVP